MQLLIIKYRFEEQQRYNIRGSTCSAPLHTTPTQIDTDPRYHQYSSKGGGSRDRNVIGSMPISVIVTSVLRITADTAAHKLSTYVNTTMTNINSSKYIDDS